MQSSEIGMWAAFLRPFLLLALMIAIVYPLRWLFERYMPEGRIKRFLLRRVNE